MLNPSECIYTAITFAPVQGFIEKSRKLRDLYGSSFILSYLARSICEAARERLSDPQTNPEPVVSPALVNVTQGTPNQIVICGDFSEREAREVFDQAWRNIVLTCRQWIEQHPQLSDFGYCWRREWNEWANHAWEFFLAQGESVSAARTALNERKRSRHWIGVNWVGESSTLSGADAVAYPGMGLAHPIRKDYQSWKREVDSFYPVLSQALGRTYVDSIAEFRRLSPKTRQQIGSALGMAIINPAEQLSIPELVKRLITVDAIADTLQLPPSERPRIEVSEQLLAAARKVGEVEGAGEVEEAGGVEEAEEAGAIAIETPATFRDLNRHGENCWTGWFQGDGDCMSRYLKTLTAQQLNAFSRALLEWGQNVLKPAVETDEQGKEFGRLVYAGGDDFMGVFFRSAAQPQLTAHECLQWFYRFPATWAAHRYAREVSVSVGFVWAAPNVPQRDVLQHCRLAERAAKDGGRDRIAQRILFNGGNHLEWICPWWFLQSVLEGYRVGKASPSGNRNGKPGSDAPASWTHLYKDMATLKARHAFRGNQTEVALALFEVYFGRENRATLINHLWDTDNRTGILGNEAERCPNPNRALNNWIISLASVGFHLLN